MALITVTGFPCSGKSTRANQLKTYFEYKVSTYEGPLRRVLVLSDDTLNIERAVYDDSRTEKGSRASLFSAVQRHLADNTILILDGMNYIKGFRYQLHCALREAKLRSCTLYVVASQEQCRSWNKGRPPIQSYSPETLSNLILRFEEPSSMVRWDSPLFTVMWSDEHMPYEDIWSAITRGNLKPPNMGTVAITKTPTNALHTLENTTATIISAIVALQATTESSGGSVSLPSPDGRSIQTRLPDRRVTLAELQRIKRQFVTLHKKAITLGSTEKGDMDWGEERIAAKFVQYIEEHVNRIT
ncbi:chromatin associated protein KTI12 [Amanita rubescens]|nr:chromatin associated protein KTI12 [Amanita rubescens]